MFAPSLRSSFLVIALFGSAVAAACSNFPLLDNQAEVGIGLGGSGGGLEPGAGASPGLNFPGAGANGNSEEGNSSRIQISAETDTVLVVRSGEDLPTLELSASAGNQSVTVVWSVNRADAATITRGPSDTATFTPTGNVGGVVIVLATVDGQTTQFEVTIEIESEQNGPDLAQPGQVAQIPADENALTAGGGPGGVGGEGLGTAIDDEAISSALDSPESDGASKNLKFVYPYEGTIFPRGILAPLVAWQWDDADADAILLELNNEAGTFSWSGKFGRPAILETTAGNFHQHPIPQNIWEQATNTAGGPDDQLTLSLTVLHEDKAYGPITQKWTVAEARLSGTIYYNSYGTNLAKNFNGAVGGDNRFGGATLSIRVGDTSPELVAGSDGDTSNCRVCHSVAANGSGLISSRSNGAVSYNTAIQADGTLTETLLGAALEFPAIYPDGGMVMGSNGELYALPEADAPLETTGLDDVADEFGTPMFSADGTKVAFMRMGASDQILSVMDFDKETLAFSNVVDLVDLSSEPAQNRAGWPAFLPDGESMVFNRQFDNGNETNSNTDLRTRRGARAQIHWASANSSGDTTVLNRLNGLDESGNSYLEPLESPSGVTTCSADGTSVGNIDTSHEDDTTLNFEPTVNPVASGGYAWVIFTSRRRYGNVATIPPYCSDPRGVDLIQNITPKKLWVAAIDLNQGIGEDRSYPAFYLPGQELLAGNSRGFWVLDPCREDGDSCESGDQCCQGFCQPDGESGEFVCGAEPPDYSCSELREFCSSAADCCDPSARCLGGFCSQIITR
ncbi:MAG: hypothetical protein MK135_01605 [Polyangiaceae bacterium]|nr:hypothetical protein [Polyangiaceae bacterium]